MAGSRASAQDPPSGPVELVGSLHQHSGYSDGWPGTTPASYFAKAKSYGLDFLGSGEHSDNADLPVTANEACAGDALTSCIGTDADSLDKWAATLRMARAASDAGFTGFRGFEWTSDRFGHINVYFSANDTNAKADGGYAVMDTFWRWFTTPPGLGGGSDGLATFNHPGAKKLHDADPTQNWNDFAYVPAADDRMVGLEVFNDDDEFGAAYYVRALDKGWHVGAVGAEDLHGDPGSRDDWGAPRWAKTVVLADGRSEAAIRAAMHARRFYAIRRNDLRMTFSVDGAEMGSRLVRASGSSLDIAAGTDRPGALVEVVTSKGKVVASGTGAVAATVHASPSHRYYFMRVKQGDEWIGYGSPVWVSSAGGAPSGRWLAGDLHVHTCYSHDAYCPPDDDNTGPEELYTLSGTVEERFLEASVRGLDFLAISDHNDVRSQTDPGFGSHGVVGLPAYEHSFDGHAQALGATRLYTGGPAAVAGALRADDGVFQINHPADQLLTPLDASCSDTSALDWSYGFDVAPDTVEVWNIGHVVQPPLPASNSNDDAVRYWECWLARGERVGATGGSDSHWLSLSLVQGPGNPTTWVFASDGSSGAILDAIRAGRTTISMTPPVLGGARLLLEADADGNGSYESIVGDTVPPRTRMRVRADGLPGAGLVRVRANGRTIVDGRVLQPGGQVVFRAPASDGWVHASLHGPDLAAQREQVCDPLVGAQTTYCRNHLIVLAQTSAIYVSPD